MSLENLNLIKKYEEKGFEIYLIILDNNDQPKTPAEVTEYVQIKGGQLVVEENKEEPFYKLYDLKPCDAKETYIMSNLTI